MLPFRVPIFYYISVKSRSPFLSFSSWYPLGPLSQAPYQASSVPHPPNPNSSSNVSPPVSPPWLPLTITLPTQAPCLSPPSTPKASCPNLLPPVALLPLVHLFSHLHSSQADSTSALPRSQQIESIEEMVSQFSFPKPGATAAGSSECRENFYQPLDSWAGACAVQIKSSEHLAAKL